MSDAVKLLLASKDFYKADPKKVKIEDCPVAGRTYFIFKNKVVAVGDLQQGQNR